jgi:hypothetical protein
LGLSWLASRPLSLMAFMACLPDTVRMTDDTNSRRS